MTHYFKFPLLVIILVSIQVHVMSAAKQYDIKHCWTLHDFKILLSRLCDFNARKRSVRREDVVKPKLEANNFLEKLSRRELFPEPKVTTYAEECCHEGCRVEEIAEYCGHSY